MTKLQTPKSPVVKWLWSESGSYLSSSLLFLLDCQQFDNVLVFHFFQDLRWDTIKNAMTALIIPSWQTSNSLIWTSCGRMWLNWLNVLTATVSPLCLLTPCNRGQSNILTSGYITNQYLENCSSSSLAKHTGCAPDVVCRTPQERHFPTELLWADSFSVCGHWRFIRGIFTDHRAAWVRRGDCSWWS